MYYVSRKDSSGRIYITDTEDGVEEYITHEELKTLVRGGVEIEGVRKEEKKNGGFWIYVDVYTPPSSERAKLLLSSGLDIGVVDGKLVSLKKTSAFNSNRIVLGDFCTIVGANCIPYPQNDWVGITLVFDNRIITIERKWLMGIYMPFKVDFTNITNPVVVHQAYESVVDNFRNIVDADTYRLISEYCLAAVKTATFLTDFRRFSVYSFPDDFVLEHYRKQILRGISGVTTAERNRQRGLTNIQPSFARVLRKLTDPDACEFFTADDIESVKLWLMKFRLTPKVRAAFVYVTGGGQDSDIVYEVSRLTQAILKRYYKVKG